MDKTNKISSFLNQNTAYLLGLIIGKGKFVEGNNQKKLIIDFPYKNLEAKGYEKTFDTFIYLSNSLDRIVNRIKHLGLDVDKIANEDKQEISISITWSREELSWQFLHYLLNEEHRDFHSLRVPEAIFQSDKEIQKEFLRGYFDVTGFIRKSNYYMTQDKHRIYLEIDQRNWFLTIDIYHLFKNLNIPIQTINFGHPNFRDPYSKKQAGFWAKEHQLKIFANRFLPIGSYLQHKQEVLEELASKCDEGLGANEPEPRIKQKPTNPEENSEKLPEFLRGKHFNHSSELIEYLIKMDNKNE